MVRSTKSQRLREKVAGEVKRSKQTTLFSPHEPPKPKCVIAEAHRRKKQIEITEVTASAREDELELRVGFRLVPSRSAFSRVSVELHFDGQKVESLRLRILQGPLATDESEFASVLGMTGIPAGGHVFRVEMYEQWSDGERLTSTSKELAIDHVPVKKEERLISVPIVKRLAGTDLDIVSDLEKEIYRELQKEMKRDSESKRNHW